MITFIVSSLAVIEFVVAFWFEHKKVSCEGLLGEGGGVNYF